MSATPKSSKSKRRAPAAMKASKGKPTKPPADENGSPPESFIPDPTDRELAIRAMHKRKSGKEPTAREAAALHRESVRQAVRAIPQKIWREMSGRQAKVINEQADRHGLPFGGATVDLYALVPALHNFLARHKHRLAAPDDPRPAGDASPSLEQYREERAKLARLDRLEREGVLVSRETLHDGWLQVAAILRRAAEVLQRQHGADAHEILDHALDEADRVLAGLVVEQDSG